MLWKRLSKRDIINDFLSKMPSFVTVWAFYIVGWMENHSKLLKKTHHFHSTRVWSEKKIIFHKIFLNYPALYGPDYLKKSRPKKLVKSNKSISRNFILTQFHFLQFQKWQKTIFQLWKKFKTAKNAISRKKFFFFYLFDLTSFFAWTFLNFLARYWLVCWILES